TGARGGHGFLVTGRDRERAGSGWVLDRPPLPFETSVPGVFAIGDVRSGSSKRLGTAVGEGAAVVPSVHDYLGANHDATHDDRLVLRVDEAPRSDWTLGLNG